MTLSTILETLTTNKARDVQVLDVTQHTPFMDTVIICTATSSRHAKSVAESLIKLAKSQQQMPSGVEGLDLGEWVLVNLDSTVAHIMLSSKRELYQLDTVWALPKEILN